MPRLALVLQFWRNAHNQALRGIELGLRRQTDAFGLTGRTLGKSNFLRAGRHRQRLLLQSGRGLVQIKTAAAAT